MVTWADRSVCDRCQVTPWGEEHTVSSVNAVDVLREAGHVYRQHAAVVVGTSVLLQGIHVLAGFAFLNQFGFAGLGLMGFLGALVAQVTIGVYTILLLHLRAGNGVPTMSALISAAVPRAPGLLVLAFVVGTGTALGFLFLIVPGVFLTVRWAVAAPAKIAGRLGTFEAMKSSWHLTGQAPGSVFVIVLFQLFMTFGVVYVSGRLAPSQTLEDLLLAQALVGAIFTPFVALSLATLFLHLSGYTPDAPVPVPGQGPAPTPAPLGIATATGQYEAGAWVPNARLQAAQPAAPPTGGPMPAPPYAPPQPHAGTPPPPSQPHVVPRPHQPTGPGQAAAPPPHAAPPAIPPPRTQSVPPPGMV